MKAFITGGAGYIGSHASKALAGRGHEIMVYDNLSTGHRHFARYGEFVHGDVRDNRKLRGALRNFRPDVVIHFAALSCVGESVINPGEYFRNNVDGTLSLLEAMRDENVQNIVVSSSSAVYGQPEKVPIDESRPTAPVNPYGESKLFMERMLAGFGAAHNLKWISLRYFNAAGSDPDGEVGELHAPETHLVPRVIMAALGILPKIEIFGTDYPTEDGTCIRDYIHVNDLANAHIMAAQHLLEGGASRPINLGSGTGASVLEIVRKLEEISGKKIPCDIKGRRAGDPPRLVADASLAKKILGWQPERGLETMLMDAWNFLSANRPFLAAG